MVPWGSKIVPPEVTVCCNCTGVANGATSTSSFVQSQEMNWKIIFGLMGVFAMMLLVILWLAVQVHRQSKYQHVLLSSLT